jgi:hypothetical protein
MERENGTGYGTGPLFRSAQVATGFNQLSQQPADGRAPSGADKALTRGGGATKNC